MDRNHFFNAPQATEATRPQMDVVRLGGKTNKLDLLPEITLDSLPPAGTTRWVMRRKAEVVAAVHHGLLTLEEVCTRYTLSVEEFLSWQEMIDRHGVRALRATCLKTYRDKDKRKQQQLAVTATITQVQRLPHG